MNRFFISTLVVFMCFACKHTAEEKQQSQENKDDIEHHDETGNHHHEVEHDQKQDIAEELTVYDFKKFEPLLSIDDDTIRVINFWATWCMPCIAELPAFEMLNERYATQNVEVILVSLDMESQIQTKLIPFIKKKKLESKVLVLDDPDANTWIPKVDKKWSGSIPATLIYEGDQRYFYEQSFTYETLEAALKKVL